jgi:DNA-binding response OmpR family regulator
VLSREHLLARVWGNRYEGGPRTVDIHVRRLRAKLGPALPLETLRGSGYKLRSPETEDAAARSRHDEKDAEEAEA